MYNFGLSECNRLLHSEQPKLQLTLFALRTPKTPINPIALRIAKTPINPIALKTAKIPINPIALYGFLTVLSAIGYERRQNENAFPESFYIYLQNISMQTVFSLDLPFAGSIQ